MLRDFTDLPSKYELLGIWFWNYNMHTFHYVHNLLEAIKLATWLISILLARNKDRLLTTQGFKEVHVESTKN